MNRKRDALALAEQARAAMAGAAALLADETDRDAVHERLTSKATVLASQIDHWVAQVKGERPA